MMENVIQFKKLILARLQGKAGPPIDARIDERYPDWLVKPYAGELNAKQRSDFTQAVIELKLDFLLLRFEYVAEWIIFIFKISENIFSIFYSLLRINIPGLHKLIVYIAILAVFFV